MLPIFFCSKGRGVSKVLKGGCRMKFSDLFIPKIARSDPKVREQAILKCKDVELLKRVIANDKDEHVRRVAEQRIQALMPWTR
jgi:hypothetical protein